MAQMTDTTMKKSAAPQTGAAAKPTVPELHGELPGEKARDWIRRDAAAISPSYTRSYGAVIERGEGCTVWDVDGNAFVDVSAGIAVCATGHCHPKVVKAIQDQAAKLIHMSGTDFYYPSQIQLAEKLTSLFPGGGPAKAFFGNSGAEAHFPFGGVKDTGNGHREGGWPVYDFFSDLKTVYVDYSGKLQKAQIDV
jgi:hypothetical protein